MNQTETSLSVNINYTVKYKICQGVDSRLAKLISTMNFKSEGIAICYIKFNI